MKDEYTPILPPSAIAAIQKAVADHDTSPLNDQKSHPRLLREAMFNGAVASAQKYKQDNPDARGLRTQIGTLAYEPQPAGYKAAILDRVSQWFDSEVALAATNRVDVSRLNAKFQTDRYNPNNHFSKPLSPSIRQALVALFQQRGAVLPDSAKTMSDVRKAARAFKASSNPEAEPFGNAGSRSGNMLTIGRNSYRVEEHKGQECIRVTVGNRTQRINLTTLKVLIGNLVGVEQAKNLFIPITSYIGDLAPRSKTGPSAATDSVTGTSSPRECSDTPAEIPRSLSERLALLSPTVEPTICTQRPPDYDPLCDV